MRTARLASRWIAVTLPLLAVNSILITPTAADQVAPVYQRHRMSVPVEVGHDWRHRGQGTVGVVPGGFVGAHPWWFVSPPVVAGSWYQRPYPEHLEYFRLTESTPHGHHGPQIGYCLPAETPSVDSQVPIQANSAAPVD